MIAVDASAIVAILLGEPEAETYREFLLAQDEAWLSPIGYWEITTRLRSLRGEDGLAEVEIVLAGLNLRIADASARTARLASRAEGEYGKRTAARLNLGDCFAYALAKELDAPLLFKGDDFDKTDVRPVDLPRNPA